MPLKGPAYFVSHGGEASPNLDIVLQGYGVTIDLTGNVHQQNRDHLQHVQDRPRPARDQLRTHTARGPLLRPRGQRQPVFASRRRYNEEDRQGEGPRQDQEGQSKTTKQVAESLAMPTAFIGQNGAEIHQSTPISVTGCAKAEGRSRQQPEELKAASEAVAIEKPKGAEAFRAAKGQLGDMAL